MSFCRGVVTGQAMSRASLAVRDDALCGLIGNSATAVESSAVGRLCCKSRFALMIKNSAGYRRGFRVKM